MAHVQELGPEPGSPPDLTAACPVPGFRPGVGRPSPAPRAIGRISPGPPRAARRALSGMERAGHAGPELLQHMPGELEGAYALLRQS